jgi:predicted nucleic-acid-binding Zn-ribbon protein
MCVTRVPHHILVSTGAYSSPNVGDISLPLGDSSSFQCENNTFVIFTVKITECGYIEFYSKDKLQYFTVENVIKMCIVMSVVLNIYMCIYKLDSRGIV